MSRSRSELKVYLSKDYAARLQAVVDVSGKSKAELIREAIDYLYQRYVRNQCPCSN